MLVLIDASALAYRMYYAFASNPLFNSKGENTSAIYGFNLFLERLFKEWEGITHLGVAFDLPEPTFRHELLKEYKATREKMPEDLRPQIDVIRDLVKGWGGSVLEKKGYEADDIIGTFSYMAKDDVYIFSGDKDLMQLVNDKVKMVLLNKIKGKWQVLDIEGVKAKMGVYPFQIVDYLLLVGDVSDNVIGIKGIGQKTAIKLLNEFGNINGIIENREKLTSSLQKKLMNLEDHVHKYREIIEIKCNIECEMGINDIKLKEKDMELLADIGKRYEIRSLMKTIDKKEPVGWKIQENVETADYAYKMNNWFFINIEKKKIAYSCKLPQNIKYVIDKEIWFRDNKIFINAEDIALMSYMIHPEYKSNVDFLMTRYLDINPSFNHTYIAEKLPELYTTIKKSLSDELYEWYKNVELPLSSILREMEEEGIKIDTRYFNEYAQDTKGKIDKATEMIYAYVGETFNLNSPKQLQYILFEKLKLPPIKKTKTGYSTDIEVLNRLKNKHIVVQKILEYRELFKLYSTYLQPLPAMADEKNRLHTSFHQRGTITGRLSSSNPNLQNIPADIRKGFIADEGKVLISADYSQIELRVMAHLSKDPILSDIFHSGGDIHTQTVCHIFGIKPEEVEPYMRRQAKVVNYGILYGMSDYGLAKELGISVKEASEYIKKYFERFKGVKEWIDKTIKDAEINGYVEMLSGRRRYMRELRSANRNIRENSQRSTINAPVQGSAADIIKKAMILLYDELKMAQGNPKILLQVHDELVVEVEKEHAENVADIMKETMENAIQLNVPILVDIGIADNWRDAH